jgi:hypothetical protein
LPGLAGKKVEREFKWNDNMQDNGNFLDFYVHGGSGPGRWFSIVYIAGLETRREYHRSLSEKTEIQLQNSYAK